MRWSLSGAVWSPARHAKDSRLHGRGSGTVDVVYLDDSLRVFRSKGSVAVQIRADLLQS